MKDWDINDENIFCKDLPFYIYDESELFHRGIGHVSRCLCTQGGTMDYFKSFSFFFLWRALCT